MLWICLAAMSNSLLWTTDGCCRRRETAVTTALRPRILNRCRNTIQSSDDKVPASGKGSRGIQLAVIPERRDPDRLSVSRTFSAPAPP
ncbi:hypothetical protein EVAR_15084_1 [Eumeta japonica]|uniref:Secreted protein n=1 Tax=Eumeta variegata TaxID=151549 RepID=A0A4C1YNA2_EUMVA|nr:hypothetical protein EVAR_15084_1 [Eumeta japonica]